jgi:hypothetical protein
MPDVTSTGFGITIGFSSGFFAEIIDTTPPEQTREAVDTSHTETPEGRMTFIPSKLIDGGELQVEMAFHPDVAVPIDADPETVTITFPSGTTWVFQGFLTGHAPAAPIDDRMTATVTIKVSGAITITGA